MKRLFALLIAIPLFMVACNYLEDETPKDEPQDSNIKLELKSESTMTFDAEGGNAEISYTLSKESDQSIDANVNITNEQPLISVTTKQEWITLHLEDSLPGTIKFEVVENTASEERVGSITGSYDDQSFNVTIKQAGVAAAPIIEGWSVVGSMTNNWDTAKAIQMEAIEGYFVARGVAVSTSDSFKFIKDGSMQNGLGGNGQKAERDYRYAASKYGSDIRVKENGTYDLYINEALSHYYIMGEGNDPDDANEIITPGEDIWYVTGIGESQRMRQYGLYQVLSNVSIDEDGFKLYHSLSGKNYGAKADATVELGEEIAIEADSEYEIKARIEANKSYDIYLSVEHSKVWVMPRGSKPDVVIECDYAEGVWFTTKNFMIMLQGNGIRVTLDCDIADDKVDDIIPAATYSIGGEDGYIINAEMCEVANEDGKQSVISGTLTISHIEDGYDVYVDVYTSTQRHILAHFCGKISSNQYMGGAVENPTK